MKSNAKYFIILTTLFSITNAKANIESNVSNLEMNYTLSKETQKIIKDKNLNYLFENSKFPVDDYIYKAGKRKPENKIITYEEPKKQEEVKAPKIDINATAINNLNNIEKKLKNNEKKFEEPKKEEKQQIKYVANNKQNDKKRLEKLLRDSILANRTSEIKDFQNNNKFGVDGFSNQQSIDISTNEHKLSRMIRAGRLIPALLMTPISSDVSGLVSAQIEQDIYAAHGRAVLIPRGSKAIGFYSSTNSIGETRLEIQWREIITPQGINILLTNAFTADSLGMNGVEGAINNKYMDRYAIPLGISTIGNGLLLALATKFDKKENGTTQVNQYQENIFAGVQNDINEVVRDIIQQHKNIHPTIEIQSGSRIFLVPSHHMWFSKPKNNEVLMKYFVE